MKKLYGFRESDAAMLCSMLSERKAKPLKSVFEKFSECTGKSVGTARNLYYAVCKRANADEEFCQKFLGGQLPKVAKNNPFGREEEQSLIEKVADGRRAGKSVRSVIMDLANGDGKVALRYQNKFRGIMKKDPERVASVYKEKGANFIEGEQTPISALVSESQLMRVKREINALVEKIAVKKQRENQLLKSKIAALEAEIAVLRAERLYKRSGLAERYFGVGSHKRRDRAE